jgi:hypothetical protein
MYYTGELVELMINYYMLVFIPFLSLNLPGFRSLQIQVEDNK